MEEKGSDVNLALHLLNDAWKGLFDAAVVISNDTDLITPIRMVAVERAKPIFVVCPGRWQMAPQVALVATLSTPSPTRHARKRTVLESHSAEPRSGNHPPGNYRRRKTLKPAQLEPVFHSSSSRLIPIRSRNATARALASGSSGGGNLHARPFGVCWTIRGTLIVAA